MSYVPVTDLPFTPPPLFFRSCLSLEVVARIQQLLLDPSLAVCLRVFWLSVSLWVHYLSCLFRSVVGLWCVLGLSRQLFGYFPRRCDLPSTCKLCYGFARNDSSVWAYEFSACDSWRYRNWGCQRFSLIWPNLTFLVPLAALRQDTADGEIIKGPFCWEQSNTYQRVPPVLVERDI